MKVKLHVNKNAFQSKANRLLSNKSGSERGRARMVGFPSEQFSTVGGGPGGRRGINVAYHMWSSPLYPVDRQTDKHTNATEDITFPQIILADGKYRTFAVKIILYKKTGRILPLSGSSFCFRRFQFLTVFLSVCLYVCSIRPTTITNTLIVHESCLKCVFSTTDIV